MIMKCLLGSPWRNSDDDAAMYEEFCQRMKEVGKLHYGQKRSRCVLSLCYIVIEFKVTFLGICLDQQFPDIAEQKLVDR